MGCSIAFIPGVEDISHPLNMLYSSSPKLLSATSTKAKFSGVSSTGRVLHLRTNIDKEPKLISINDVCVEKDFYTLPKEYQELGLKKDLIETEFFCKRIEPRFSKSISLIKSLRDVAYKNFGPIGFDLGEEKRISILYMLQLPVVSVGQTCPSS